MTDSTEKFPPRVIVNQYGVKLTGDNPPDKEVLAAMMVWDTEYLSTQEHLSTVGKLTRERDKLFEENVKLRAAIDIMLPIVNEAFWDHHTAGTMPGSGYNHRVYSLVSKAFGWRDSKKFTEFKKSLSAREGQEA